MKAHERREAGIDGAAAFKVSAWDARSFTFREVKGVHATEGDAHASMVGKKGAYRLSRVASGEWSDVGTFNL